MTDTTSLVEQLRTAAPLLQSLVERCGQPDGTAASECLLEAAAELTRLQAELDAAMVDARRWQWLRDGEWEPFDSAWLCKHDLYGQGPAELDAFADAAIKETK
jgi:hypothetical protein